MKLKLNHKKILYSFLLIIEIILIILKKYNCIIAIILIILITMEQIFRTRKNNFLFFAEIALAYFNFSIIISKYIGSGTITGVSVWHQLRYSNTMGIGLYCMLLFLTIIGLILQSKINNVNRNLFSIQNSTNYKIVALIICIFSTFIVFDYLFFHIIITNRKIYEYCIILFVLGFYFSKNYKLYSWWLFLLAIISFFDNSIGGGRVITMQPLIAWYYINYFEKINSKKLVFILLIGINLMTILGLYGDILDVQGDFSNLTFSYFFETFFNRKFTNDTSIMAYWAGLTAIEVTNYFSWKSRINNFLIFIFIRTFIGTPSYLNFKSPVEISHDYYLHYYGGYLSAFFYFWLGFTGVILIGIIISKIFNQFAKLNDNSSELSKILCIYWLSTLPRWYLYEPTPIFRGTILLIILYLALKVLFLKERKNINEN